MAKIEVENLYKIFGPHPKRAMEAVKKGATKAEVMDKLKHGVGVNDASFQVEEGEIVVVMGLSGSGKSTLVRCINRLIEPTAGTVRIDGQEVTKLDDKGLRDLRLSKLAMVFQNFALFPHRTVADNTAYGLEIKGVDPATRRQKAMEALDLVGLNGWEDSMPGQLSGGMQQRVGLARALALDADILLMDEAFSALDPLIRSDMQDELINLQEKMHKTILFISHDLDEAIKLGDRIVLMKDGAIVQVGTAEDILTHPANDYVERFVENVDITKVLTADSVMKKAKALGYINSDGPRASLRKMKSGGISSLFVIDKGHTLQGIVYAEDCSEAASRGERDIKSILKTDLKTVQADTPAMDIINLLHDLPYPLAVVDDMNRIKGVINRGALLGAIAERGVN
ncbi:glycine betaine/proline transport system ATP-binding protein [Paucidesulfovibrio gracilis DSM 16080]|uniref:Glycine betaine/proline transport system ATP-binding protein n=1 Tax=Paucidesulfovibrio gracilis DSM 16080 TaxID=1121449 RepID=A0A1T4WA11_9BACT|nr:glycine betaine/L-proline ABC transporter ATP-binding protein [Paucidesulfovibrio gracilis]SKA74037.1 glycine betaine/proline transport system ATP-binding protein [Paucidesulfovibrio gracilis DSM 16080]